MTFARLSRFQRPGARPFRRPLENIPLALWLAGFVCDLVSLRSGNTAVRAAFICVAAGVASAILLAATTMLDYNHVPSTSPARTLTLVHATVRAATVVVFALSSWVRASALSAHFAPASAVVLSAVGLVLVAWERTLSRQVTFDRTSVIHLVPSEEDRPPPGVLPFRRPRHT